MHIGNTLLENDRSNPDSLKHEKIKKISSIC